MKVTTTRRRLLVNAGWAGAGLLLYSFTTIGLAGNRPVPPVTRPRVSAPVIRQGWLLSQDDL